MLEIIGASLVLLLGIISTPVLAQPSSGPCVRKVETYTYHAGDPNFKSVMQYLSDQFSVNVSRQGIDRLGSGAAAFNPARADAEVVKMALDYTVCASDRRNTGPDMRADDVHGCGYTGCTATFVPADLANLPVGSKAKAGTCGGGISESGKFQKQAVGAWKMTSYHADYVTSCPPDF